MNQIACPGCGAVYRVTPRHVAQSFACQKCQQTVVVPAVAAAPQAGPAPAGGPAVPAAPPVASQTAPPPNPAAGGFALDTGSADETVASRRNYKKSGTVGTIVTVLVLMLLTGGVLGGVLYAYKAHPEWFHREEVIVVQEDKPITGPTAVKYQWTDASQGKAVLREGVSVKVDRVEFAPIRGKDARNIVRDTGSASFLQFYITVRNQGDEDVDYTTWYGNEFDFGAGKVAAALTDNAGNAYAPMVFTDIKTIQGQTGSGAIAGRDHTTDVIIFEPPAGIDPRKIEHFKLQLPASAVGRKDFYRFQIPKSMAAGF